MNNIKDKTITEQIVIVSYVLESIANKMVMEPMGLTMTGFKILHILNEHGSVAVSHVIHCLGSSKSNVSQRLDFLEKNKFVARGHNDCGDKRCVLISLTELGKKKLQEAKTLLDKETVKLEELFTIEEMKMMSGFLNKIFDKLIINLK